VHGELGLLARPDALGEPFGDGAGRVLVGRVQDLILHITDSDTTGGVITRG
jgi:hypothetical protein